MGRKRKHRDRDNCEHLLKKLKRELQKRRRSSTSSESDIDSEIGEHVPYYQYDDNERDIEVVEASGTDNETSLPPTSGTVDEVIFEPSMSSTTEINKAAVVISEHLDDQILTLLGEAPKEDSIVGKDTHSDIAARLLDVLQNGLKKEQKDKLVEEYPIPGNCQFFKAPILNPEVKAAISEVLQKKDSSLAARQSQVGVALSALTSAMDILVSGKISDTNQMILKHVSNASRLLCDSHYIDTKLRRNFLISTLNNKLKDTLKESKRDKHLFGETLPDSLKATKAINSASQDLKSYVAKQKPSSKNNKPVNPSNHLNWKRPQPNQNTSRNTTTTAHRTAGSSSTAHRNETSRKPTSSRASRHHAHYKNQRRR